MQFVIAGLGNPGDEYAGTRHNIGRMIVEAFAATHGAEFAHDAKSRSFRSKVAVGAHMALLVLPETFMNRSGLAIAPHVGNAKALERLIVVHDDLDLPFGSIRIVFNRGAGGHRGVASIVRVTKSNAFVRVRVGVSPTTPTGKLRKPSGEQAVLDFILGTFSKKEQGELPNLIPRTCAAIEALMVRGRADAMNEHNSTAAPARVQKSKPTATTVRGRRVGKPAR